MGGRKLGNTIDGCQAEYVRIPDAMADTATGAGRPSALWKRQNAGD